METKTSKSKYVNDFIKDKYDVIKVQVAKGAKTIIDEHRKNKGFRSINAYINELIKNDITNNKTTVLNPRPALTAEEETLLEKYNQLTERNKGKAEEKIQSLIEEQTKDNDNMQHGRLYG